ncbi:hypothetical protein D3C71_990360 [compost metagenome]
MDAVHRALVVRIHRAQAVAKEVKLVLKPETGGIKFGGNWQWPRLSALAVRHHAAIRKVTTRRVGVAVPWFRTEAHGAGEHAAHPGLTRDVRRLIEGSNDDGGQEAPNLIIDDMDGQRLAVRGALGVRAKVIQAPKRAVEFGLHVPATAEGTDVEKLERVHPLLDLVGVFVRPRAFLLNAVGCGRTPDEETQRELIASDAGVTTHELSGSERVGEALGLLERQHPQGEPRPGGHPGQLAPHSVEECRCQQKSKVGLGFPAARREPNNVHDFGLGVGIDQALKIGEQERELEWTPRRVTTASRYPHRLVHEAERRIELGVAGKQLRPPSNSMKFVLKLGACVCRFALHPDRPTFRGRPGRQGLSAPNVRRPSIEDVNQSIGGSIWRFRQRLEGLIWLRFLGRPEVWP